MEKKIRNSNIELLRIIAMFFIVCSHFAFHSGFSFSNNVLPNELFINYLTIGGKIGVNLFILISGYFQIKGEFKVEKVLKLIVKVLMYSIIFLFLGIFINSPIVNIKYYIKSFLPITFRLYWFMTEYILLYILSPYINKLIFSLKKHELRKLIIILFILIVIIPTFSTSEFIVTRFITFFLLYLIGSYVQLYGLPWTNKFNLIIISISLLLLLVLITVLSFINYYINFNIIECLKNITEMNILPMFMLSISMFFVFVNMKIFTSKPINIIAKYTFGVYLIHDNPVTRELIWKNIIKIDISNSFISFISMGIISIILVYVGCTLIDIIMEKTILKLEYKIIDKVKLKMRKD